MLALASQIPASVRRIDETKTMFLPALAAMLTEVDADLDAWVETSEEKEASSTDPYHTAVSAIDRIAMDLGEKTVLPVFSLFIQQAVKSSEWQQRQAGYMTMGLIAECSKESLLKNMDEAMKLACAGVLDDHPRVRYAGLSCLALLLTELAPKAQKKYHAELMPVLIKMMAGEALVKIQTHAISATINFASGLTSEDEEDDDQASSKIMGLYAHTLFETLVVLLKKGIDENYEPLQEEVMKLLAVAASLIETQFAQFYNQMMPMMI